MVSVLTIAGTDSSGGAGVAADLKTFTALECYGALVVTAITAQNTIGVQGIHPCPPSLIREQLKSVFDDIHIQGVKTGMLHDVQTVTAVVDSLSNLPNGATRSLPPLVVDPVTVSTSGHALLETDAIDLLLHRLLPMSTMVTPNLLEAELLLGRGDGHIVDIPGMVSAAQELASYGPKAVLVKGGHLPLTVQQLLDFEKSAPSDGSSVIEWADQCGPHIPLILRTPGIPFDSDLLSQSLVVVDVLHVPAVEGRIPSTTLMVHPRLESSSTHGTGCTLSAALCCALAKGVSVLEATRLAITYTHQGIATATPLGGGHGPLNHIHPVLSRVIPLPTPTAPYPFTSALIKSAPELWRRFVQHPFVIRLGQDTLPRENFIHFIKQDYHYLKHYARAYSLLGAKSSTFATINASAQVTLHIVRESSMHQSFCALWGVSPEDLDTTPESATTTGYATYILDAGLRGDEMTLLVAVASCLLGYGEVGLWLKKEAASPSSAIHMENNAYKRWIEDYSGLEYQGAVRTGIENLERRIAADPPSSMKFQELQRVWEKVVKFEVAFWDMAMALS